MQPRVFIEPPGAGFILIGPGFTYSNQAGGVACLHPAVEGSFVGLARLGHALEGAAENSYGGLSESEADEVDAVLTKYEVRLRVDRERLADSLEAWVYCRTLDHPLPANFGDMPCEQWPAGLPAVLVWENSD